MTPDGQKRSTVDHVSAPNGQAIGVNYGQVWQQRFSGPFRLLRHSAIPLDPLPGDLRLTDPANPDNPVARFRGRGDLIATIDAYLQRCVQQRRGGYLLIEAEAGMGKSALATYLAYTRTWPAHFTRLTEGRNPETARLNLAAQLIARWKLDAAPGGALPDDAATSRWLYGRLCDAAQIRDSDTGQKDQPVVLLVDGLDEAPPPPPGELPLGLPTSLPPGTVIVATTRPRTLAIPAGTRVIERIDVESTTNRSDLLEYLTAISTTDPLIVNALHLAGMPADRFCRTLLDRSGGVWIYALTVLDQIRDHGRNPTDVEQLPEGLASYYIDSLERWRSEVGDHEWTIYGLPVLVTLMAVREPQSAATIAAWSGVPASVTQALIRETFRPFLATRRSGDPDLYLPRHQSLREFISGGGLAATNDEELRHIYYRLSVATKKAHERITDALTPPGKIGHRDWHAAGDYARKHLPEHAAISGLLENLVNDPKFLLLCRASDILRHRRHLRTVDGIAAINAFEQAHTDSASHPNDPPTWWLHIWARKTRAAALAEASAQVSGRNESPWWNVLTAIWTGTTHRIISGHPGPTKALTALPLPNGRTLLASAGDSLTVQLWDPVSGQSAEPALTGHTRWLRALITLPLPDGRTLLASAGDDGAMRLWDPATRQPASPHLIDHGSAVFALAVVSLPAGDVLLASAGIDRTVRLWDPATGQLVGPPLTGHAKWIRALAPLAMPDGHVLLASAGDDSTVRLWDPTTRQPASPPLTGHTDPIISLAAVQLSDGRTLLASAGNDRTVRLWDPIAGQPASPPLTGHTSTINALTGLPLSDGRTLLASAGNDRTVRLWDPITGQPANTPRLTGHTHWIRSLAALPLPDGRVLLASGSEDGSIRLWDSSNENAASPRLAGHTHWIRSLAALPLPDGRVLLASAGHDNIVRIWDPSTGHPIDTFAGHTSPVNALSVLSLPGDRILLASASDDQTVRLWDPIAGEAASPPLILQTEATNALAAIPLPDGRTLLASGGHDAIPGLPSTAGNCALVLWDPSTGEPATSPLIGHTSAVKALVALPLTDSRIFLASAGYDQMVRFWDPTTGKPASRIPFTSSRGLIGTINALAALPLADGRTLLASAGNDSCVRLWDATTGQPAAPPLTGHTGTINALAALPLPDGRTLLASAGNDNTILIWNHVGDSR